MTYLKMFVFFNPFKSATEVVGTMFRTILVRTRACGNNVECMASFPCPPPKLLVVNFPINLRCYVLLGCRVINVILAIHIGDSAF